MKNYNEMYEAFQINEESKAKFDSMAEAEFSKRFRVAKMCIEKIVYENGKEKSRNKEVIHAKLV